MREKLDEVGGKENNCAVCRERERELGEVSVHGGGGDNGLC